MLEITLFPSQNTYISEWYPVNNFNKSSALFIGQYLQKGDIYRTLLQFDLSEIPSGATIKQATLEFNIFRYESDIVADISICQVLNPWQEDIITWHTPIHTGGYQSNSSISRQESKILFDITELIKGWHKELIPNYGLLIKGEEGVNSLIAFRSVNYLDKKQWPTLYITYEYEEKNTLDREELLIPKYPPYAPLDVSTPTYLARQKNATFLIKNNSDSHFVKAIAQVGYSQDQNETFFNTGHWVDLHAKGYPGEGVAITVTDIAEYARVLVQGQGGESIYVWVYTSPD